MATTREIFAQHPPPQTAAVNDYTNRAVVTPQAAFQYRATLKIADSYKDLGKHSRKAISSIRMQDFHQLSSEFLIDLALFDCKTVTCTAAYSRFPAGVIQVARQEKSALSTLKKMKKEKKEEREKAAELLRQNPAWIVSVFEVWMAI
ncbi:hypothetical protein FMEXI_10815 [Fusarium mexicanum]|uniref:Uncharacterized protein n=1 Tax=Fusarium mexicanum TaxID=751941 RepID=A0A8H5IGG7_9HYPO|nr:hypothetical protein FMEXI_10815 [Fusarium mexicanum]